MSDIVIKAEGLGKKYLIGHQQERERYTALRDVIARSLRGTARKARQVFSGQQLIQGDSVEEFWALRDLDFEIKQGDRVGIIGRNGAGKSTLLKILSRITEPSTGKVTIKGRVASLLEVGTGFHPELTGRENIFLNGAILGMSRAEIKKKFDEIVAFAEVEKFLDTPVKRYSSGMYVRLAFAVAAHLEPEILIVDEVLAVGDAQFQKKCLGKMEDVSKNEGRTVLFVSHNMGTILQLCNKALLMSNGSLVMEDSPDNVINLYFNSNMGNSFHHKNDSSIGNDKDIYFEHVKTVDENGLTTTFFAHSQNIKINFSVVVNKLNPIYNIGIVLLTRDKKRVFTVNKSLKELGLEKEGIFVFNFSIPGGLIAPSDYSFICALNTKTGLVTYDWLEDICAIKIYDDGTDLAFAEGLDYGCIIISGEWDN